MRATLLFILILGITACDQVPPANDGPEQSYFTWDNANVYFMMTDRFYDGNPTNNYEHTADNPPAPYRGYMGGDIKGITQKIKEGYFTDLGVNAIWMTPLVEQITGSVDEGTGNSFGFHGYWTRDWTSIDEKFGTREELQELIKVAHDHEIRVLMDVVANHTGPVTDLDAVWPEEWVKTGPQCEYKDAISTINCTLVQNLPDIRTESEEEVSLPPFLVEKWKSEGRYEQEVKELDEWFARTGYKRSPVNYILKWLVDFIKEYGVDGFRVDTVKHTEDYVWSRLSKQASAIWEEYKKEHPEEVIDQSTPFYMVGEVYNYYISGGREFDYGDKKVDFFKDGFHSMINFDFKSDALNSYEEIFTKYDSLLHGPLIGKSVLNYISSHDDGGPYDLNREQPIKAGTKLLLCPGGTQIYYGDETARTLTVAADGDATLRSFMNWEDLSTPRVGDKPSASEVLAHWQKLGQFRRDHPSVGAGRHQMMSSSPYTFSRTYTDGDYEDKVVVALDIAMKEVEIDVAGVFQDGEVLTEEYGGSTATVQNGKVTVMSDSGVVLLGLK